jgi:hypothetical protein
VAFLSVKVFSIKDNLAYCIIDWKLHFIFFYGIKKYLSETHDIKFTLRSCRYKTLKTDFLGKWVSLFFSFVIGHFSPFCSADVSVLIARNLNLEIPEVYGKETLSIFII